MAEIWPIICQVFLFFALRAYVLRGDLIFGAICF